MHLPRLQRLRPLVKPLAWFSAVSVIVAGAWPDLGLNLMADSIALWFGVFVVDHAMEEQRRRERAPALRACYAEATDIMYRTISLCRMAVEIGARAEHVEVLREVQASREWGKLAPLAAGIDVRAFGPMVWVPGDSSTYMTWREILIFKGDTILKGIDRFISRYAGTADSELVELMQQLEHATILSHFEHEDRSLEPITRTGPGSWELALQVAGKLADFLKPPYYDALGFPFADETLVMSVYNQRVRDRGLA